MRTARAALLAAVALLLAGCTAIPTSGPVQTQPPRPANNVNPVFQPSTPLRNASRTNIVEGFVYAQSAPTDAVAKLYLTGDFARRWNPNARVLVQSDALQSVDRGDDGFDVTVPVAATIGPTGAYTPDSGAKSLHFSLQKVAGQWRISDGPNGVVLPQTGFQQNLVSEELQYFDPTWKRLVPDVRFFPSGAGLNTRILTALLTPVASSSPLHGVVASAFPTGTRLTGVSKSAGVTTVTLGVPDTRPVIVTTDRMQQQIAGSLGARTTEVRLIVNGSLAPTAKPLAIQTLNPNPIVLANGRFGPLGPRGVSADPNLGRAVIAARPRAVTFSKAQGLAAVQTASWGIAVVDAQRTRTVDAHAAHVAPTIDQRRWTYWVPADDPTELRAITPKGEPVTVAAALRGAVVAIEASFDGTRMLVLTHTAAGRPLAYVAGIVRGADGTPTGLTSATYDVPLIADDAVDATWVDDSTVAVLTGGSDQQTVVQQRLGGVATELGRLPSSTTIVGTSDPDEPLRVLTTDADDLYGLRDDVWQADSPDQTPVSVLAVQR